MYSHSPTSVSITVPGIPNTSLTFVLPRIAPEPDIVENQEPNHESNIESKLGHYDIDEPDDSDPNQEALDNPERPSFKNNDEPDNPSYAEEFWDMLQTTQDSDSHLASHPSTTGTLTTTNPYSPSAIVEVYNNDSTAILSSIPDQSNILEPSEFPNPSSPIISSSHIISSTIVTSSSPPVSLSPIVPYFVESLPPSEPVCVSMASEASASAGLADIESRITQIQPSYFGSIVGILIFIQQYL